MKTIIFIADRLSQPRIIKRILSIYSAGFKVKVFGYDRIGYQCNSLPAEIEINSLGELKDGSGYLQKIKQIKKDVNKILEREGKNDKLYYSFGFISTYFLNRLSAKYIYEQSDILYGYRNFNLIRPFLKIIDKKLISNSVLTIMTSGGFKDFFFGQTKIKNIIIQPNKLNKTFLNNPRPPLSIPNVNHLRFGFIGAVRYKETILRFAKIIGKFFPQHEFHFYGNSRFLPEFQKETIYFKNVIYHGEFRNPEDLLNIYNKIDIVVACYETTSLNERVAEPNKMYEAIYFQKPIIVSKDSFVEKQIKKYKCGFSIDAHSDKEIIDLVQSLDLRELISIMNHELSIKEIDLIDNPQSIIDFLTKFDSHK